jgi:DNA-binding IscR family transcriptional regulator
MKSLKSLLPQMAQRLGTTPAALYERQRALVRAGLVDIIPGRGAGSGVRATPHALAMLLISLVATGSLSEVEAETTIVARLKSDKEPCPITGKKTFGDALTVVLASKGLIERLDGITVTRSGSKRQASLITHPKKGPSATITSNFGDWGAWQAGLNLTSALVFEPKILKILAELNQ